MNNRDTNKNQAPGLTIREKDEKGRTRLYVSDEEDEVHFTKFKKGIYYPGKQNVSDAVDKSRERGSFHR
ncbi:MAG: hypothetical protein GY757_11525 [bacterium]|nr:hypothetical protein [bacterium]